jgi:NitT/TauT family transport system ATP-binding protein
MICLREVSKTFGENGKGPGTHALSNVELTIEEGEFACLLGPSGCGKSTVLSQIAGFDKPSSGEVLVNGRPVESPGPDRGVVFQEANLMPWLTVVRNVTFGPELRGIRRADCATRARAHLEEVGLHGFEGHLPMELSGGMRQRVALARVLINDPSVLLMDEPFGALDAQTRMVLQELLLRLWERERKTVLFVTHDIEEAILLADRIHVMTRRPGTIKATIPVDLPRPRAYESTVEAEFAELKAEVLRLIREETQAAPAPAGGERAELTKGV